MTEKQELWVETYLMSGTRYTRAPARMLAPNTERTCRNRLVATGLVCRPRSRLGSGVPLRLGATLDIEAGLNQQILVDVVNSLMTEC